MLASGKTFVMMQALRHWTLDEANAALPGVADRLEKMQAAAARLQTDEAAGALAAVRAEPGGSWPGHEVSIASLELARASRDFDRAGIVVRDLESGLIDFPSLRDGEEVYLCWLQGEERVEHWHPVHAGFAGRRRL